jgi:hypothetical protein
MTKPGFADDEFLSASVAIERDELPRGALTSTTEFQNVMRATETALADRLTRDPSVLGVTFAREVPGNHPFETVEFSGVKERRTTRLAQVDANYLDVFGITTIAGRRFVAGDVVSSRARPVVVNRTFAERMPGGGNVIGRFIRFPYYSDTTRREEWREIAGLVEDFPAGNVGAMDPGDTQATVYEPMAVGEISGATLLVHTRGKADVFTPRLREIAIATDPSLQFRRLEPLETTYWRMRRDMFMTAVVLVTGIGSVLLLSGAGMYALMSFTVSQRRREIGVRAALGADARRLLASVLSRAARQLAMGVVGGLGLVVIVDRVAGGNFMKEGGMLLVPATAIFMVLVGVIAAAGPARYGLRIQPTEALRSE